MKNDGEAGYPDGWGLHLMTDDVDATAKAVAEHGGKVEFEPMTVGENGRSTMLKDPGGAMLGAWQPGTQKGFEVTGEPGTPTWFELHTRDYGKSVSFYRDVFKWDAHAVSDTDEFRYTTLGEGDGQLAGIMDDSPYPGDDPPTRPSTSRSRTRTRRSRRYAAVARGQRNRPFEACRVVDTPRRDHDRAPDPGCRQPGDALAPFAGGEEDERHDEE